MPGVPSGRGCNTCRRHKKKCDQLKPRCSRCVQLNTECVGAGEQRFVFKTPATKVNYKPRKAGAVDPFSKLSPVPSNASTQLASAFIHKLQVLDLRYGFWVYGNFLEDIPRRLGNNSALDNAVDLLTTTSSVLYTKTVSVEMQQKYLEALGALRTTLEGSAEVEAADILCAVHLVIISQHWLGMTGGHLTSHSRGTMQVLKPAAARKCRSAKEDAFLKILCFPVVIESIFDPWLELEPWFYNLIRQWEVHELGGALVDGSHHQDDGGKGPIASLFLRNLVRLAPMIRDPSGHLTEALLYNDAIRVDLQSLSLRMDQTRRTSNTPKATQLSNPPPRLRLLLVYQTAYGILLAIAILLNAVLRAYADFDPLLISEGSWLPEQVLSLAEDVSKFRPLGAAYMPMPLMVAWAASTDSEQVRLLGAHLSDWQTDFSADYLTGACWVQKMLEAIRMRQRWTG